MGAIVMACETCRCWTLGSSKGPGLCRCMPFWQQTAADHWCWQYAEKVPKEAKDGKRA